MPEPKAQADDRLGRFREIVSDPNNARIPRVEFAGMVLRDDRTGESTVVMHNGIRVLLGQHAYYDDFAQILIINRGVHEPQEEYAFGEVLKYIEPGLPMIELGSYWAFYSLWYRKRFPGAPVFLAEPDEHNLQAGRRNFQLNGESGEFIHQGIGPGGLDVNRLVQERGIDRIGLLHADIQGAEGYLLASIAPLLVAQRIDYLFVSTHSQELHRECLDGLRQFGYRKLAAADFDNDTFAYDGLIVAASPRSRAPSIELYSRAANHRIETVGRVARTAWSRFRLWGRSEPGPTTSL
jgi:hypothetical protein